MGTRSMTYVVDEAQHPLCAIYCQYDGYPEGMGARLKELLQPRCIGNGIIYHANEEDMWKSYSNGVWDLAAQIVMALKEKTKVGTVYLYPVPKMPDTMLSHSDRDHLLVDHAARRYDCEYIYIITEGKKRPVMKCYDWDGHECADGCLEEDDQVTTQRMLINPATGSCATEEEWRADFARMSAEEWGGTTFESAGLVPVSDNN